MSDLQVGEWEEMYDYRGNSLRDGVPGRTRGFRVEGMNVDVAVDRPGLPQYGDEHPDDPGLLARDRTSTPYGTGALVVWTYVATAYFGGSGPAINQFAEGFIGKDVSFDSEDVEIPLFRRAGITTTVNDLPVSQIVFADFRSGLKLRRRTPYYSVPIAIELPESNSLNDVFNITQVIVAQFDKIHTIFGKKLLFACEGIDQNDPTRFKATYRWYEDQGIPNTLSNQFTAFESDNLGRIGTTIYPFFDSTYMIPPFKGMRIDGNPDPTQPPDVTFFDKHAEEPNGWQTLPGIA